VSDADDDDVIFVGVEETSSLVFDGAKPDQGPADNHVKRRFHTQLTSCVLIYTVCLL